MQSKWIMPDWMEKYRDCFRCGGRSVEDLMNGHTTMQINSTLAFLESGCEAQVELLGELHRKGLLQ